MTTDLLDALDKLVEPDEDLYRELPVATQRLPAWRPLTAVALFEE
jgi:hypothetical protein